MARVFDRTVAGRLILRDKKGNPILTAQVSQVSYTESRDCYVPNIRGDLESPSYGGSQLDFDITVESLQMASTPVPPLSNAQVWDEIEALEASYRERDITYNQFIARRRALILKLQGPINHAALERMQTPIRGESVSGVIMDESSDLKNYQSQKNLMFAALYGARPDILKSLLEWRQVRRRPLITSHAGFVGSFDEVTAGGAHRKNYVFDLEDSW